MSKKTISLLLALLTLASGLVACSGETAGGVDETSASGLQAAEVSSAATETTETAREDTLDSLPKLDFKGAGVRVLFSDSHGGDADAINWAIEDTGDTVVSAQYAKERSVEERLNVKLEIIPIKYGSLASTIRSNVLSGTDAYDIIDGTQSVIAPLVTESLFVDLWDAKYLDYDQPWWANDYMNEMSIGDHRYFLFGDVSLSMLSYMSCMYFNKDQFKKISGETDGDLYKTVLDGGWTVDKLAAYCKKCYSDLNGDGKFDDGDQYGAGVVTASTTDHMVFDAGIRFTARDKDDVPYFTANNQNTIKFAEKLYSLFYENEGVRVFPATQDSLRVKIPQKFIPGEMTFMYGYYYSAIFFRDMETDYGIIPYPKLDEATDHYRALVHNSVCMLMLPITCKQTDTVCAVIEACAAENYRTVTPAYYEVALKTKYIRDDTSGQIIDMIHQYPTTDFAYVYGSYLDNLGLIMRTLMENKSKDFASLYASKEASAKAKLTTLVEAYKKLG